MAAIAQQQTTFLPPIERPRSLFLRLGYYFMRKKFGKVMTPASVFSARMPTAFTTFYGKVGRLDKKLSLAPATVLLLRERVASVNGCRFCMDATRAAALELPEAEKKMPVLDDYGASPLFSAAERAALDYATELASNHAVATATFDELKRHFGEREICDIVWVVASEHLFNLTNIGLNIGSDGFCELAARKRRASWGRKESTMLGRKDYRPEEVARAKKSIAAQLAAYKKLANAVAETGDARSQAALEAFAPPLFEQLLLALDRPFVHRLRMTAGKDGNPLNELELLCESVLNNAGRFRGNNVIQYHAAGSVLGLEPGDPIRLSAADFERLSKAFFRELEARFL